MLRWTFLALAVVGFSVTTQAQTAPRLVTEEFMVPARDPGIEIYVRNKRPETMTTFSPERIVVFVHGATYPAHSAFDLRLGGTSWMEYIAARGYDVYLLDLRGYGRSTRPAEMAQPASANGPIVTTEVARRDVDAVVDFVRSRRGVSQVALIGWSWGTHVMGSYAAEHPAKVNRVVLYAPIWLAPSGTQQLAAGPLGAYRTVQRSAALARWLNGVPEDKRSDLIPAGWFDAWADATFASDPEGAAQSPPVLRAPNGVLQDAREFWFGGKPGYDPAKIVAPTLLVVGDWDRDTPPAMAQALLPLLVNAPSRRLVMIREATHTVIMEKNRMELFRAVQGFLDEGVPPSVN